jgi:hypothetical protein
MVAAKESSAEPEHEHDDVVVICCSHVLDGSLPILRVSHDHDGDWQMHCAVQSHDAGKVAGFQCMLKRDATIAELAAMPVGWSADRDSPEESWLRSENPPPDDDE